VVSKRIKLRQERHGGRPPGPEYAAPTGLEFGLACDSTNMPRLRRWGDRARGARTMLGDDGNQIGAHSTLLAASKQLAAS